MVLNANKYKRVEQLWNISFLYDLQDSLPEHARGSIVYCARWNSLHFSPILLNTILDSIFIHMLLFPEIFIVSCNLFNKTSEDCKKACVEIKNQTDYLRNPGIYWSEIFQPKQNTLLQVWKHSIYVFQNYLTHIRFHIHLSACLSVSWLWMWRPYEDLLRWNECKLFCTHLYIVVKVICTYVYI